MTSAAQAYLALPADERFETRISTALKRHAETVAKAKGESLSEYVLEMLAEKVAMDIVATQELTLTPTEQVELLRILASPAVVTPALEQATAWADTLWGAASDQPGARSAV
ncbi:MAG: DUF1778 domain-containing protein [Gemmatimonadaceae bacterium]|nr:DUF1778 domain-containing protein [Gemmatimonadaceae bacterium]